MPKRTIIRYIYTQLPGTRENGNFSTTIMLLQSLIILRENSCQPYPGSHLCVMLAFAHRGKLNWKQGSLCMSVFIWNYLEFVINMGTLIQTETNKEFQLQMHISCSKMRKYLHISSMSISIIIQHR